VTFAAFSRMAASALAGLAARTRFAGSRPARG